ncbi:MAG: O-antigen ligase family protein [Cycloclasticus sp.]|nr:O-antigen ligase family protein [Cycloclasticus sp.]
MGKSNKAIEDSTTKIWSALLLAVMALWPTYLLIKLGGLPAIDARRIAAGFSIVAMIYFLIARKSYLNGRVNWASGPLQKGAVFVGIYALWRFASCFSAHAPLVSIVIVLWEVVYYYSMFFVGAIFFSRIHIQNWLMIVFMALVVIISFFAGIEWLMEKNLLLQFAPVNEQFAEFNKMLTISRVRDGFYRAQSTFEHPLLLAEFSAIGVCFSLASILWNTKTKALSIFYTIVLILSVMAAALTGSRSALITIVVGAGVIIMLKLFSPKELVNGGQQFVRKLLFIAMLIGAVGVSIPLVQVISEGKTNSERTSTDGRVFMLNQGLENIEKRPIFGFGPGSAGELAGIKTGSGVTTLDNYFLAIAIESGIPALLLLFMCLLYPVWVIFNRMMNGSQYSVPFLVATLGSLLVIILQHAILWMPYNMTFTYLFSGSALALLSTNSEIKLG